MATAAELTDAEAIGILGVINADGFNGKCAFEINKQMRADINAMIDELMTVR